MLFVWSIYLVVIAVTLVFFILYKDLLALILFMVVLAIPVLMFIIHLVTWMLTRIQIQLDSIVISKDKTAHIRVTVKNKSIISITGIKIVAKCQNGFIANADRCEFMVSAKPLSTQEFDYEVSSDHFGNVNVIIKRAYMYDYFHLFALPLKLNGDYVISIVPQPVSIDVGLRSNNYTIGESNLFSKVKAGDDPSEVFKIRDYLSGDKINRIHWKLSSKQGHYMIKDYSLPILESVLLFVDLCCDEESEDGLDLLDTVIEAAFSISSIFIERSIIHSIGWYDLHNQQFCSNKISSLEDLFFCFGRIYGCSIYKENPRVVESDLLTNTFVSHLVYITCDPNNDAVSLLSQGDLKTSFCSVIKAVKEITEVVDESADIPVIPVKIGEAAKCLYNTLM